MKYLASFLTLMILCVSCKKEKKEDAVAEVTPVKKYTIAQFSNTSNVGGGVFSADETKMLYSNDETGIYNVYEVDLTTNTHTQKTLSEKESFYAQGYVPNSDAFIYRADKGGNELSHIFLQEADGTVTDLTPGEKENARFSNWSKDKQYMYYGSNGRDARFFDLLKMKVGEWKPIMVYQNNDGMNVASMTDNEQFVALTKTLTTSSNQLFIVDNKTGEKVEISDPESPGSYGASGFSKDNTTFYYTTDKGKEFTYLASYNLKDKTHNVLYETNWGVSYSYLSENEKYRVIGINADGKNELVIQEVATGNEVKMPEIKDGDIQSVLISDSEKLMRLSVGTSRSPRNNYLYNFETSDLKQLTNTLNKEVNVEDLVEAEVVRYPSFDGTQIPAIYYKPKDATADNKVPALVWVHGGPGGQSRVGYFSLIQYLVNHGYAVLAVNNRGSSGYGKTFYRMDDKNHGEGDLQDCVYGKKWLQSQDYIDTEKIGIIGGSYGGYMTMAALTYTPEEFKVGVNIFGVTNWMRTLKSIPPYWESFRAALYQELGDPFTQDSVRLKKISPLFHAHNVTKPLMVLQGANDPRVLKIESDEIVEAVKKNNVPVEYVVFDDEGHGFRKKENQIKGYGQIKTFLDTYLKQETDAAATPAATE